MARGQRLEGPGIKGRRLSTVVNNFCHFDIDRDGQGVQSEFKGQGRLRSTRGQ